GSTFFRGLEELPAASLLRFDGETRAQPRRYWTPRYEADEEMTYGDAVEGVRARLARAVEIRLRADVPLAFCMSGGVDSNALIAVAKNVCGYDVHGFTVLNRDARYAEQEAVERTVAELGLRHTTKPVEPTRFLERLRELVRYHDAPVYTISYYAHWL